MSAAESGRATPGIILCNGSNKVDPHFHLEYIFIAAMPGIKYIHRSWIFPVHERCQLPFATQIT